MIENVLLVISDIYYLCTHAQPINKFYILFRYNAYL